MVWHNSLRRRLTSRERKGRSLRQGLRRGSVETLETRNLLTVTSSFAAGVLTVTSDADDALTINAAAGNIQINGADPDTGTALAADVTSIQVTGGPGANVIDLSGVGPGDYTNPGLLGNIVINGGDGDDTITGSQFADTIIGGVGDDVVDGGLGDDTIVWNNGDGSDTIDGGAGADRLEVNGSTVSPAGDQFTISANGPRLDVTRADGGAGLGPFTLDVGTIETLDLNTLEGNDSVTVGDLTGVADLASLHLSGGAGNDTIDASALPDLGLAVTINGGAGDDTLTGSQGVDTINGDGAVQVTVTNLAPTGGTLITPVFLATGNGTYDFFNAGSAASASLESLAEDGATDSRIAAALASGGVAEAQATPGGPLAPGDSQMVIFEAVSSNPLSRFLSFATMLLPSNDAFVGNDDPQEIPLFDMGGNLIERTGAGVIIIGGNRVLDAGTEVNDEAPANTPVLGQMAPNTGVTEGGVIGAHPGFIPGGNVLTAIPNGDFTVPGYQVLQIEITALSGNDTIVGGAGDDIIRGQEGDDTIVWNNGDGSDTIDGGVGADRLEVNGSTVSPAGDQFTISANGPRLDVTRADGGPGLGPFTLDVGTIETLDLNTLEGNDSVTVNDLTGVADLASLHLSGGAGNDTIDASALPDLGLAVTINGGAGDDTLTGSQGVDTINGDGAVQVTVTNLAPTGGTLITPVFLATGNGAYDFFNAGSAASASLESLAEDGATDSRIAAALASGGVAEAQATPGGPLAPGDSQMVIFEAVSSNPLSRFLSFATMLLPSNDAFVGNDDPQEIPLFDMGGNLIERTGAGVIIIGGNRVLDAGTEVNDEIPANTPVLGQMAPNTGVTEGGVIGAHPGFIPGGNVLTAIPNGDFTVPGYQVLQIEITALSGNDTIVGGAGDDIIRGQEGDDTIVWNNGDGSDTIDGGAGADRLEVNGSTVSPAGDQFTISVNGPRLDVTRADGGPGLGPFTLDVGTVETLDLNTLGGEDSVTVNNLTGVADLTTLNIDGGAQNDMIDASALPDLGLNITLNGGEDLDTIIGSGGVDTINGGDDADTITGGLGNDNVNGNGGDDLFIWNNGDGSDTVEGGADDDRQVVNGATAGDMFNLQANATRLAFERTNLGLFSLDLDDVEEFEINSGSGEDEIVVGDTVGTDLQFVDIDAGPDNDRVEITPSPTVEFLADGGLGVDVLDYLGNGVNMPTNLTDGTISQAGFGDVNYLNFETVNVQTIDGDIISADDLTFGAAGDGTPDEFVIRNDGGDVQVFVNGSPTPVFSRAAVNAGQLLIRGSSDDDTLVVDNSNGLVLPEIIFDGDGVGANGGFGNSEDGGFPSPGGFDTLQVINSESAEAVYNPGESNDAGLFAQTLGGQTQRIEFFGLEPVQVIGAGGLITVGAQLAIAGFPQALNDANDINYDRSPNSQAGFFAGLDAGRVTVDAFESLEFANFTTLVIDAGAGSDEINLDYQDFLGGSVRPSMLNQITVAGNDPTASDTLIVNSLLNTDETLGVVTTSQANGRVESNVADVPGVVFSGIEHLNTVFQPGDADRVAIDGTAGNDRFEFHQGAVAGTGTFTGTLDINGVGIGPFDLVPTTYIGMTPSAQDINLNFVNTSVGAVGGADQLIFNGTSGVDEIALSNDSGDTVVTNTIAGQVVANVDFNNDGGDESLVVRGQDGDDVFNHGAGIGAAVQYEGGNPDSGSDTLNFAGGGAAVTLNLAIETIQETGFGPVSYAGIEQVNIDANAALTVLGTADDDQFDVTPLAAGFNGRFTHNFTSNTSFHYTDATAIDFQGGSAGFDALHILGDDGANTITSGADDITVDGSTVTVGAGINQLEVHAAGGDDSIDLDLQLANVAKVVDAGDGNDSVDLSGAIDALIFGGAGNDVLIGSPVADMIFGGPGNDILIGGGGSDRQYGEDGNDIFGNPFLGANGVADDPGQDFNFGGAGFDNFVWEPGDGPDVNVGGDDGADVLRLFGDAGVNSFTLSADGGTPTNLVAVVGGASIDNRGIEDVLLNGQGGADTFTVNDLYTTEVVNVTLTLGVDDEQAFVNGRDVADDISITAQDAGQLRIEGLRYDVRLAGATTADMLTVSGSDGDDTIKAVPGVENTVSITLNGDGGDDFLSADAILNGGADDDTLEGGAGSDTYNGGDGNDTLIVSPGDDVINGDAGFDRILYPGSENGAPETYTLSQAGSTITVGGLITGTIDIGAVPTVESFDVEALGGDDSLTVDVSAVPFALPIRYDGGRGNDLLTVTGTPAAGAFNMVTYTPGPELTAGRLQYDGVMQIDFIGLEPVIDLVGAAVLTVNGTAAANQITYQEGSAATRGLVTVDDFESIEFENKATLRIAAGEGDDTVILDNSSTPTALVAVSVGGEEGRDTILATADSPVPLGAAGGSGDDVIDLSAVVSSDSTLVGDAGDDVLTGGAGADIITGGTGNDTITSGLGANMIDGGDGIDTIVIPGTAINDRIDVSQDSASSLSYEVGNTVNGFDGVIGGAGTTTDTLTLAAGAPTVEIVRVEAGDGDDIIRVQHADALGTDAVVNSLRIDVDGGPALTRDRLAVVDNGTGDLILYRQGESDDTGSVTVGPGNAEPLEVNFRDIEFTQPVTAADGDLVVFKHDPFEFNDDRVIATRLGTDEAINVDPTIDPAGDALFNLPGDSDWYRVEALENGTLDFQVFFRQIATLPISGRPGLPGDGDLNIEVTDSDGTVIAGFGANDADDDERVRIPAVAGQTYFLRVFGASADAINVYNFSVINDPPPVPYDLELQDTPVGDPPPANSDTGRSQFDNHTRDNTPTIFFRLDDGILLHDLPGNSTDDSPPDEVIDIPFQGNTLAPGYRIAVFDEGSTPGQAGTPPQTPLGFAVATAEEGVYSFTTPALSEGSHFLTARVQLIDPATPTNQTGFGERSASLEIVVDVTPPPVSFGLDDATDATDGLRPESDSGVAGPGNADTFADRVTNDTTPTFWGVAEANSIIRLYVDLNGNGTIEPGTDLFLGQTVALPEDGTNQFPEGFWELESVVDLNDPGAIPGGFATLDGLRTILVEADDLAGNRSAASSLEIFIDTQGPQVTGVRIQGDGGFNLFEQKDEDGIARPTPLVNALEISVQDLPNRVTNFLYNALQEGDNGAPAENPGNYQVVGDHNGVISIQSIVFNPDAPSDGNIATGTIVLTFAEPLPDDRFTLTIKDDVVDPAGNRLDGESDATEPEDSPSFPTGDGQPGGDFVARFTVDSRPEIGVWANTNVYIDTNGNFVFDPEGKDGDDTNEDIVYQLGINSDDIFAGNFYDGVGAGADGFDKLGAYGRINGEWRWLIDVDNDGVPDLNVVDPAGINGTPVAGNFDGDASNGDEVGIFTGDTWWIDTDRDWRVDQEIEADYRGLPIVGDFDGDGNDDLAAWADNQFVFDFVPGGFAGKTTSSVDATIAFGHPGLRERPVAADMNQDGIDDIGLFVSDREGQTSDQTAEWSFLISRTELQANGSIAALDHPFEPQPFSDDLFARFGEHDALPLVGNFDPPVAPNPGEDNTGETTNEPTDSNEQTSLPVVATPDMDNDGRVGFSDLAIFSSMFTMTVADNPEAAMADLDGNGRVGFGDLAMFSASFLSDSPEVVSASSAVSPASALLGSPTATSTSSDAVTEDAYADWLTPAVSGEEESLSETLDELESTEPVANSPVLEEVLDELAGVSSGDNAGQANVAREGDSTDDEAYEESLDSVFASLGE